MGPRQRCGTLAREDGLDGACAPSRRPRRRPRRSPGGRSGGGTGPPRHVRHAHEFGRHQLVERHQRGPVVHLGGRRGQLGPERVARHGRSARERAAPGESRSSSSASTPRSRPTALEPRRASASRNSGLPPLPGRPRRAARPARARRGSAPHRRGPAAGASTRAALGAAGTRAGPAPAGRRARAGRGRRSRGEVCDQLERRAVRPVHVVEQEDNGGWASRASRARGGAGGSGDARRPGRAGCRAARRRRARRRRSRRGRRASNSVPRPVKTRPAGRTRGELGEQAGLAHAGLTGEFHAPPGARGAPPAAKPSKTFRANSRARPTISMRRMTPGRALYSTRTSTRPGQGARRPATGSAASSDGCLVDPERVRRAGRREVGGVALERAVRRGLARRQELGPDVFARDVEAGRQAGLVELDGLVGLGKHCPVARLYFDVAQRRARS